MNYHGIIVDNSLEDTSLIAAIKTISMKRLMQNHTPWYLRLVTVTEQQLDQFLKLISEVIKPGWYTHFYNDQYLIVVFRDQVFRFPINDKRSWRQAMIYGKHVGIKPEQLDFWPHTPHHEQQWLIHS